MIIIMHLLISAILGLWLIQHWISCKQFSLYAVNVVGFAVAVGWGQAHPRSQCH